MLDKKEERMKGSYLYVVIVLLTIIVLSIFMIILSIRYTTANEIHLPLSVIIWSIVNSILVFMTYYIFKQNIRVVTRWQENERLRKWIIFLNRPIMSTLLLLVGLGSLWMGAILFWHTLWFVQTCFTILFITCMILWETYSMRDRRWSKCPHCRNDMSRKQIFQKSFIPFREKCDFCNKLIYANPRDNQNKIIIYLFPLCSMSLHTLFDLHLFLVLLFAVGFFTSFYYFVLPYLITFSDKEQGW